jgi:PAS domain S-box-containing protein
MSKPLRVLIVEDSEDDMNLLLRELRRSGYDVTFERVETADAMRAALDNMQWDVVLSDFSMPRFSAPAALTTLQEQGWDVPFIIVSGTVGEEAAVAAMKAGAHDFFSKDKLARLTPAIERELREAEVRRNQRLVESAQRESERRFRLLAEAAPEAIILADSDGRILLANAQAEKTFGYSQDMLVGQSIELLIPERFHEAHTAHRSHFTALPGVHRMRVGRELSARHKDGSEFPVEVGLSAVESIDGMLVAAFVMDISERKRLEQRVLEAERLRVEIEKERELIQLKERFISVVSHEFRTPLSVIMSSAELVDRYHDRMPHERQLAHIQEVLSQAEFMVGLLDDVLTVNKARAGRLEFNPAPLDLETFCRETLERIQAVDKGKHAFLFDHDGDLSSIVLDAKLLQHILVNLLSNAGKYSPDGGDVNLNVSRSHDEVTFRVSDQGIGIPPESQARLFEPFHRADNVGNISGTGLGLAIVKESVDLHKGTIVCDSTVGVSTTFTVRLPVAS